MRMGIGVDYTNRIEWEMYCLDPHNELDDVGGL